MKEGTNNFMSLVQAYITSRMCINNRVVLPYSRVEGSYTGLTDESTELVKEMRDNSKAKTDPMNISLRGWFVLT